MTRHHPSHPHVVRLPISRAVLGDARFEWTLKACRYAARLLSTNDFHIQAVYEDHQRVAYLFAFRTGMQALRLALYHRTVVEGRPFPLKAWT